MNALMANLGAQPAVMAGLALLLLWVTGRIISGSWWPWDLAKDDNGTLSASKLQIYIWTAVTLASYCAVVTARLQLAAGGDRELVLPNLPLNLLVLMGMAAATTAGSRAITVSYLSQGRLGESDQSSLGTNRQGNVDLTKVQMLIWTFIGAIIYTAQVILFIRLKLPALSTGPGTPPMALALPDVDGALLVLMGAAQGAYIAGKLASSTAGPVVDLVSPSVARGADPISISLFGVFLGDTKSEVLLEPLTEPTPGPPIVVKDNEITLWTNARIDFVLPAAARPTTQDSIRYRVRARVAGQLGTGGTLEVAGVPTTITSITPNPVTGAAPVMVTAAGRGFGPTPGEVQLFLVTGGAPAAVPTARISGTGINTWSDIQVSFVFPQAQRPAAGASLIYEVRIAVGSKVSAGKQITVQ